MHSCSGPGNSQRRKAEALPLTLKRRLQGCRIVSFQCRIKTLSSTKATGGLSSSTRALSSSSNIVRGKRVRQKPLAGFTCSLDKRCALPISTLNCIRSIIRHIIQRLFRQHSSRCSKRTRIYGTKNTITPACTQRYAYESILHSRKRQVHLTNNKQHGDLKRSSKAYPPPSLQ